ncbi:hypothetical protein OBO34_19540 [Clostridiales Family XIII bacterium ASD5510]|uniref:DUF2190 domain-containing protein n=1 Tax=Hominibacterium faecale TaxID=2839743 RepID=A0A9J6QYH6_9FIRM|nr:hypothetical protein [Hominibacterium faecale]MCU7380509.1 hypothetical protein [Hominibacterium faecale]
MALDKKHVFTSTQINPSPTITGEAGAAIDDVRCKGVKYDDNGKIVLASTAGEAIIGVGIITNNAATAVGEDVDIQVKDIGAVLIGADVKAGAELAVDANGTFHTATASQFVAAISIETGKAGQVVRAQMVKYFKASA